MDSSIRDVASSYNVNIQVCHPGHFWKWNICRKIALFTCYFCEYCCFISITYEQRRSFPCFIQNFDGNTDTVSHVTISTSCWEECRNFTVLSDKAQPGIFEKGPFQASGRTGNIKPVVELVTWFNIFSVNFSGLASFVFGPLLFCFDCRWREATDSWSKKWKDLDRASLYVPLFWKKYVNNEEMTFWKYKSHGDKS